MKSAILLSLLILTTLSVNAQKETRNVGEFSSIDVGESITVYLTKGNSEDAIIETSGVNTDKVLTENTGGRLKIHMKSGSWRSFNATVYLEFDELDRIEVSSSADVIGKSTLTGDELDIEVSSSGSLDLDVNIKELTVEVSSSGKAQLSGRADFQDVEVNSSGKLLAFDLEADKVKVEASSSGKAEVKVMSELDAEANSAGRVRYQGSPEKVYVSSNSAGSVKKY